MGVDRKAKFTPEQPNDVKFFSQNKNRERGSTVIILPVAMHGSICIHVLFNFPWHAPPIFQLPKMYSLLSPGIHVGHHLDLQLLDQLHLTLVQLWHRHF